MNISAQLVDDDQPRFAVPGAATEQFRNEGGARGVGENRAGLRVAQDPEHPPGLRRVSRRVSRNHRYAGIKTPEQTGNESRTCGGEKHRPAPQVGGHERLRNLRRATVKGAVGDFELRPFGSVEEDECARIRSTAAPLAQKPGEIAAAPVR